MDYSQFLAMKQEIALLVVFLLVFLYDTFMPRKALGATSAVTSVLFLLFTVWSFIWGGTADSVEDSPGCMSPPPYAR